MKMKKRLTALALAAVVGLGAVAPVEPFIYAQH